MKRVVSLMLLCAVLAAAQSGEVHGKITDVKAAGIVANVELIPVERLGMLLRAESAPDGSFRISGAPPGWYLLHASGKGFIDRHADVEVTAGQLADAGFIALRVECYYSINCGPPPPAPAANVRVRGRVVSQSGDPIGDPRWPGYISFLAPGPPERRYGAEISGPEFEVAVPPDEYTVRVEFRGFQSVTIKNVVVAGRELGLSTVTMTIPPECDIGPCRASAAPEDDSVVSSDALLRRGCGVDLSTRNPLCEQASNGSDIALDAAPDGAVYLVSKNGAEIMGCEPLAVPYARVRIDHLRFGEGWCVRTHNGQESRVFLRMDEVPPNADQVAIWSVTRR